MQTKNKNEFWVNAETIMQMTGWNKKEMFIRRKDNPGWWKLDKKGRYLHDANSIPESMLKKQVA